MLLIRVLLFEVKDEITKVPVAEKRERKMEGIPIEF